MSNNCHCSSQGQGHKSLLGTPRPRPALKDYITEWQIKGWQAYSWLSHATDNWYRSTNRKNSLTSHRWWLHQVFTHYSRFVCWKSEDANVSFFNGSEVQQQTVTTSILHHFTNYWNHRTCSLNVLMSSICTNAVTDTATSSIAAW